MSPPRVLLIIFATACLIGGGGVLYLNVENEPTDYYSVNGGFDYGYAIMFASMGAVYFGPILFFLALLLYGFGYVFVVAVQLLLHRK